MKKLKKLITNPGIFFRDFFTKRYPIINCEQAYNEQEEFLVIKNQLFLTNLESQLNSSLEQEIDVVFTWVNNSDIEWQDKYNFYSNHVVKKEAGLYALDCARFDNHNELYFSLKSVETFLPWVRKIFIVTDKQRPEWLVENDKIQIVDHSEFIDKKYLPTFNSHVIEAHLHKIKDLSENFIYFNDDVFVARPLDAEHFYRKNGLASIFVAKKSLTKMVNNGVITPTLSASMNSNQLLHRKYKTQIDFPLVHTYVPLKKSIFELAWSEFEEEIHDFLNNNFRSNLDLILATFLIPWMMYYEGKSVITPEICYYFNIRSANAPRQYEKILTKKLYGQQPHSFCANDFNSEQNVIQNYQQQLEAMLKQYYSIDY